MTALIGRPQAVVFDCDGLLVDSEPWWEQAEMDMFARRGLVLTPEQRAPLMGMSGWEVSEQLTEVFHEPGQADAIAHELFSTVADMIRDHAVAMPGAADLIRAVIATGVPLVVASNSTRSIVDADLVGGGLDGLIHEIVCVDDVARPKPAPDIYLLACERLGATPARSVGFEDSPTGLTALTAAGLFSVVVPSNGVGEMQGDFVVSSLADPALLDWVASWG